MIGPDGHDPYGGEPVEEGAPTWMVTFGDLMSLLLTFFILLFSMSELKIERFLVASQSLREAMGGTATRAVPEPLGLMPEPVDPDLQLQEPGRAEGAAVVDVERSGEVVVSVEDPVDRYVEAYLDSLAKRLQAFVDDRDLAPEVRVERAGEGVYLRMETAALFASGEAEVRETALPILAELALLTRTLEVGLAVSGHADDRPMRSDLFASNWELSAARAAGVARLLVEAGQSPRKIRVESFGEHRPIADNETPAGRARNRRVDLFFARSDVVAAVRKLYAEGLSPRPPSPGPPPPPPPPTSGAGTVHPPT